MIYLADVIWKIFNCVVNHIFILIVNGDGVRCYTVPVGGAQEVLCVPKVISMDLHSQISHEAGVKISKMISWENFEKTQF